MVVQEVVSGGGGGEDAATFYVFMACGVLIVLGAAICCFGIFVHFTTKKQNLRYRSHSVLRHHGPPRPALSAVNTLSVDPTVAPMAGPMAGQPPMPRMVPPERDGFALHLFTAPTGSLSVIGVHFVF